jgi:hypothetical protein
MCGASIYSGAYNISWKIEQSSAENIVELWGNLALVDTPVIPENNSGYMGCYLVSSEKEKWYAYKGVVSRIKDGNIVETRLNNDRMFEREILSTAPGGSFPRKVFKSEFEE